jgi:hypothetical protein
MRTQVDTQPKEKTKTNNQQKSGKKRRYAKRTHDYKMTIDKEDSKQKSCHLPQID